ncbi:MAG TPA: hypothetical protein PK735_00630, partial [Flavobacteriales bacterium]|nr:hypothetical protein [Flavobacteriales bacterium]
TPEFAKDLKQLKKKYPSIISDIENLAISLQSKPQQGVALGNDCYKIRMSITSKGRGKSGGARVVTCVVALREKIFLLSIFDKSEMETPDAEKIQQTLNKIDFD